MGYLLSSNSSLIFLKIKNKANTLSYLTLNKKESFEGRYILRQGMQFQLPVLKSHDYFFVFSLTSAANDIIETTIGSTPKSKLNNQLPAMKVAIPETSNKTTLVAVNGKNLLFKDATPPTKHNAHTTKSKTARYNAG